MRSFQILRVSKETLRDYNLSQTGHIKRPWINTQVLWRPPRKRLFCLKNSLEDNQTQNLGPSE